jgi:site-specific DNA recombinase
VRSDAKSARSLRCAIYARVSTESGLEQDFNSLDNQREASEAYIRSQAHEGWKLARERYDDGGYSGGTMDRPALQRLIDDVRGKRIDVIVVYKVDRLTRSLADFAKLVELFDAHGVSFISVTQAFNTTTSMGRLTLNMLLSFAQFEREITGERIRDKVAASKKKGIWMGGAVPLGYRVESRALKAVESEAEFVQTLFRRYLELGSVVRLQAALDAEGVVAPVRVAGSGRMMGGARLSRGPLYWILSNPIYVGRLRHKGRIHQGKHPPIIDQGTWDEVQRRLRAQTQARRAPAKNGHSFLAGKLYDDRGNRMGPSHARKGSRCWRYYISRAALTGRSAEVGSIARICASQIETFVIKAVEAHLKRIGRRLQPEDALCASEVISADESPICDSGPRPLSDVEIKSAIERVTLSASRVEIALADAADLEEQDRRLVLPWTRRFPHRRRDIIQPTDEPEARTRCAMRARAREVFIAALSQAHRWLDELLSDAEASIATVAARERKSERSIRMTLSLVFLAPDLVRAAIEGRLPRGFNQTRLVDLPMLWSEQWRVLGLEPPAMRIVIPR